MRLQPQQKLSLHKIRTVTGLPMVVGKESYKVLGGPRPKTGITPRGKSRVHEE